MADVQHISRELLANDARTLHGVQKNAKAMMKRVIDRLDDYPEAKQRLVAHLKDKDNEMRRLEQILYDMGESASPVKDATMSMMGSMTGAMTAGLEDDIIQTSMVTFGLASYEICAYEGMISLAEKAGAGYGPMAARAHGADVGALPRTSQLKGTRGRALELGLIPSPLRTNWSEATDDVGGRALICWCERHSEKGGPCFNSNCLGCEDELPLS
jgi:ferritin-like metal-binding protein YciE